MRFLPFIVLLLMSTFNATHAAGPTTSSTAAPAPDNSPGAMRVVSYNLRWPDVDPPNAWTDRRPVMAEQLRRLQPDLVGTQEGLASQLDDIQTDLGGEFARFGISREPAGKGEHSAVFYRKTRFELLEHGDFWLSDTPTISGSMTWGNMYPRLVSWGRLRDRTTDRAFVLFNAHFDHQHVESRHKSAQMLRQRIDAVDASVPVVVTGDFNAPALASETYRKLVAGGTLRDAWETAEVRGEPLDTFAKYQPPRREGIRIDWILIRGDFASRRSFVDAFEINGQYASDHVPLVADLVLPRK